MAQTVICGVDLGTRSAHLAVFDPSGTLVWVTSYVVSHRAGRGEELFDLMGMVSATLGKHDMKTFIEEPPSAGRQNKRVLMQLGQTCGALLSTASHGYLVPVSTWKKDTVGSGNATKGDVSAWLAANHPAYHAACDDDQNRIDAVVIGLYGLHTAAKATQLRDLAIS